MRDRGNTSETGRENEPGQSPESDLLPVLKGWFSSPLQAVHQFSPSIRLHLSFEGCEEARAPPGAHHPGLQSIILTRLVSLSHPRPKGRGFQVVSPPAAACGVEIKGGGS